MYNATAQINNAAWVLLNGLNLHLRSDSVSGGSGDFEDINNHSKWFRLISTVFIDFALFPFFFFFFLFFDKLRQQNN